MTDWLKEAGDEAMGEAMKQIDLVNMSFTIHGAELRNFKDKDGKPGSAYMGTISLDGQEEYINAWLGGVRVMSQMAAIVKHGFPIHVKQVMVEKAYDLEMLAESPVTRTERPHSGQQGFAAYLREQEMNGNEALQALGVAVASTETASGVFKGLLQQTMSEHGCSEDSAYDLLLGRLRASAATAEDGDIPFEAEEIPFD